MFLYLRPSKLYNSSDEEITLSTANKTVTYNIFANVIKTYANGKIEYLKNGNWIVLVNR